MRTLDIEAPGWRPTARAHTFDCRDNAANLANRFDCVHSALAPGTFDGEMAALQRALLAEEAAPSVCAHE